jgi:hypothetical protein
MSFLKKLGKIVNKVTDFAAPIAGYVPGLGAPAAGLLKGAGALAGGKNLGQALKAGLATGGQAFIGGKLASALTKAGKLGSIASKIGIGGRAPAGVAGAAPTGVKVIGTGPGGIPILSTGAGGASSSILQKLGSLIPQTAGGGTDWKSILGGAVKYGLPALGAYQASKTAGKANDYRNKAIKTAEAEYAAAAPLRTAGLAGLQAAPRDISGLFGPVTRNYRRISV